MAITKLSLCVALCTLGISTSSSAADLIEPSDGELRSIGSAALSGLPEGSLLLAVCGPSDGRGLYTAPAKTEWLPDPISKRRMIFVMLPDGQPNVMFQDVRGTFTNALTDGASLSFSFLNPDKATFGIIELYEVTGVVQTYNLSVTDNDEKLMLWTSSKNQTAGALVTKVAAFSSRCVS